MSVKHLNLEIAKREGGKISLSIAQINEVVRHLADLCAEKQLYARDFKKYVAYRKAKIK